MNFSISISTFFGFSKFHMYEKIHTYILKKTLLISHGTLVGEGKDEDMFDGKRKEVCFISITLCRGVSSVWHKIEFKKRTKPLGLFLSTKLYIYSISSPAPAIANYISRPETNM